MSRARTALWLALAAVLFAAAAASAGFDLKKFRPGQKTFSNKQPIGVSAIRGLDEPGSEGDRDARDPAALAWLEAQTVAGPDVDEFIASGGLEKTR